MAFVQELVVVALSGVTALGAALVGGVFFAFSGFVMRALGELDAAGGMRAMQAINRTAVRAPLMLLLFGTLLAGLASCVLLAVADAGHALWWGVAAEAVYLVGVVGVTIGFHVPRNDALAAVDAARPDATAAWLSYRVAWTRGNHVRVLAGAAAALLFGAAGVQLLVTSGSFA
ncbi:MAG: DUF1772 domain-containing protein [Herbiconiux sp.]|nr:DUF1772 domain-containing protein [Herbiconiux sp.]